MISNEKREEINLSPELTKTVKDLFNRSEEPMQLYALELITQLESHLSKARETLKVYSNKNKWDNTSFMHKNAFAYEMGYEPAQQCLAEIGGEL